MPSILFEFMAIGVLGIGSQWVAWRFKFPAIVAMSAAGLLIGPVLGLMNPQQDFGELYKPVVSAAVAIILFAGSVNLSFKELGGLEKPVFRISTIGALIAWFLGSLTAHYVAGLSWAVAFVIGALFIVTGPTVILPLLRQSKLKPRPAKILKWESIIVDPLGALLAVFAFEIITYLTAEDPSMRKLIVFFVASGFAAVFGWLCGRFIGWLFETGRMPEYLKSPAVFVAVIFCFAVPDSIVLQTGLLSVTAMGITLANMEISSLADMRHFKENISILLISVIFIMLAASLDLETIQHVFTWRVIGYVALMMIIVRPLSIFLSTIGTNLTAQEKTLVGWVAPRGIVALTVAGYFASVFTEAGYEDAGILMTLTFGLVIFTVVVHGFSMSWLAKKLDLSVAGEPGVLLVGSDKFTAGFASALSKENIPVLIVDSSWERLREAREMNIPFYHGEMLSEQTEYQLDTMLYDYLIAATDFDSYNTLVATTFVPEYGRTHIFRIVPYKNSDQGRNDLAVNVGGRHLFGEGITLASLNERLEKGYKFRETAITGQYGYEQYMKDKNNDTVYLCILKKSGQILFYANDSELTAEAGDYVFSLTPPEKEVSKIKERLGKQNK